MEINMRKRIETEVGRMTARLGLPSDSEKTGEIVRDAEAMYDSLTEKKLTELEAYRQVIKELDRIEEKLREERKAAVTAECVKTAADAVDGEASGDCEAAADAGTKTDGGTAGNRAVDARGDRAAYNDRKMKRLVEKLNAVMWLATPALYVILSSAFGGWGKWWLLFLSSSIGSIILDMLLDWNRGEPLSRMKGHFIGILWLAAVIAYFLLSFAVGWKLTWIVFIVATIITVLLGGSDD